MKNTKSMPERWDICSQIAKERGVQTQTVYKSLRRRSRKYLQRFNELTAQYLNNVENLNKIETMRKGAL